MTRMHLTRPRLIFKGDAENADVIFSEPHDMPMGDRAALYGMIRGFRPETYLEIGVRWGGSARIVANAMEANGTGKAAGIDPVTTAFRPKPSEMHGRYTLIEGYSPDDTARAVEALGGALHFVLIDAVHTYSAVTADAAGVAPYVADGGHILFHDAFHQGINQAVTEFLAAHPDYVDLGIVSRNPQVTTPVSYCGMRLIRKGGVDFEAELARAHREKGIGPPTFSKDLWDHDPYAERMGNVLGRREG